MTIDVATRLGSGANGAEDIKNQPFFKEIDWIKLEKKEIPPPFKPNVSNKDSVDEIEDEFKELPPTDSLVTTAAVDADFKEFTFTGESNMEQEQT